MIRYLFVILLFSCSQGNPNYQFDASVSDDMQLNQVWICHNPESDHHGKRCQGDNEPGQCLEPGNNSKFCWALDVEDCYSDKVLPYNEFCERL